MDSFLANGSSGNRTLESIRDNAMVFTYHRNKRMKYLESLAEQVRTGKITLESFRNSLTAGEKAVLAKND